MHSMKLKVSALILSTSFPHGLSQQCLTFCSAVQIKAIKRELAEILHCFKREIKPHKTFREKQKQRHCRSKMSHLIHCIQCIYLVKLSGMVYRSWPRQDIHEIFQNVYVVQRRHCAMKRFLRPGACVLALPLCPE